MNELPNVGIPAGIAVAFATAALAAPAASAHPVDPEDDRLVTPLTSVTASANPKAAKLTQQRLALRP
jgi:hypothetical protein